MGITIAAVAALAALIFFGLRAEQMSAARKPVPVEVEIPLIDANQPKKIETATFAEG
jgi:uncharacterized membrane protein (UPF0136 family)